MEQLTEKQLDEMLQKLSDTMKEELEGKIVVDENGNRWRFHDGLWWGMCHIEPLKLE